MSPYFKPIERKKVLKIGNSLMISITPWQAEKIGVKAGDFVWIEVKKIDKYGKAIMVTPGKPKKL